MSLGLLFLGRTMQPTRSAWLSGLSRQAVHFPGRSAGSGLRATRAVVGAIVFVAALTAFPLSASATKVERIVSPDGIVAWMVNEPSVPLIALDFAFKGGSAQDSPEKAGTAAMAVSLLDEGAGDIDSKTFHERVEAKAIELNFGTARDYVSGSMRTLSENRDEAANLLKLALTSPRFQSEDVERIRSQMLAVLREASTSPTDLASERWWAAAFPGHPYGQPENGTLKTVPTITADDLRAFTRNTFARDNLKVAIVGDIDADTAGKLLDQVFGSLPAKATLKPVADAVPQGLGQKITVDLDVPQSVLVVGGPGLMRHDPDFMASFVVNHILGGSAFSSRLYKEVREARGLAYSVYSGVMPLDHAAVFLSSTGTRSDRAAQTLDVMEAQIHKLAETGPTADELAKAKSFLTGSYALRFDTSAKIAEQLVGIQLEDLGIDYIEKRNDLVNAVTMADVKRVSKRLLDSRMLVTMVGKPQPVAAAAKRG